MTWVRIDDTFDDDPRVVTVGLSAIGLLVSLLCWNNRMLADGFIPLAVIRQKAGEDGSAEMDRLRAVGLLTPAKRDGLEGFVIHHDVLRHQPTRDQVEARRQLRADAGRQGGLKSGEARRGKGTRSRPQADTKHVASELLRQARSKPEAQSNPGPDPGPEGQEQTGAARRSSRFQRERQHVRFRVYAAIAKEALRRDPECPAEEFKVLCARQGLYYDAELTRKALDAVERAATRRAHA